MAYDENGQWYYDPSQDEDLNPNGDAPPDLSFSDSTDVSGQAPAQGGDGMAYDSPQPIDWSGGEGGKSLLGGLGSFLKTPTGQIVAGGGMDAIGEMLKAKFAQPNFQMRHPFDPNSDMGKFGDMLRARQPVDLSGITAQNPMEGMADDHVVKLLKGLK